MNVRGVDMLGFMLHTTAYRLMLPAKGVVLMTGPNGAGKSSVVEGVATAGWGETLRGTPGWRQDEAGDVHLLTDTVDITRDRKASGTGKLKWTEIGKAPTEWENNPKAQAGLEHHIGSFNVWRRTHVFSSHDAEHFTMATDGERKRLLEEILNLSRFDAALDLCRRDLKSAKGLLLSGESQLAVLTGQLEEAQRRLADAKRTIAALPPAVPIGDLKLEKDRLQKLVGGVVQDRERVVLRLHKLDLAGATQLAEAREVERRATALSAGDCDRCGQGIPPALIASLKGDVTTKRAEAKAAKDGVSEERLALEAELAELNEEHETLQAKLVQTAGQVTLQQGVERQRVTATATLEGATTGVESLLVRIDKGTTIVGEHRGNVAVLEVVDDVLGMKGARAHVLGTALRGVEQVANGWLARIAGPGLRLQLKSYTEKKSGGVSDSINLEVHGAGGGYGYRASSGGERRRVDVALLLALAEVASAAHGTSPGTMWFDEVFDALDEQGVDAVRDALVELSADRAVVVVTHNQMLVDRLPATQRVRFDTGVVARSK